MLSAAAMIVVPNIGTENRKVRSPVSFVNAIGVGA